MRSDDGRDPKRLTATRSGARHASTAVTHHLPSRARAPLRVAANPCGPGHSTHRRSGGSFDWLRRDGFRERRKDVLMSCFSMPALRRAVTIAMLAASMGVTAPFRAAAVPAPADDPLAPWRNATVKPVSDKP